MENDWANAVWTVLENQGWEEMELNEKNFFYISPEMDSVDAFETNSTAFGTKAEAVIHAIQNISIFEEMHPLLWNFMQKKLGWKVVIRQGKKPWFVMPSISVSQLKPSVNLFETTYDAVEAFLESIMPYKRKYGQLIRESTSKRAKTGHVNSKQTRKTSAQVPSSHNPSTKHQNTNSVSQIDNNEAFNSVEELHTDVEASPKNPGTVLAGKEILFTPGVAGQNDNMKSPLKMTTRSTKSPITTKRTPSKKKLTPSKAKRTPPRPKVSTDQTIDDSKYAKRNTTRTKLDMDCPNVEKNAPKTPTKVPQSQVEERSCIKESKKDSHENQSMNQDPVRATSTHVPTSISILNPISPPTVRRSPRRHSRKISSKSGELDSVSSSNTTTKKDEQPIPNDPTITSKSALYLKNLSSNLESKKQSITKIPEAASRNELFVSVAKTPVAPAEVVKINRNPTTIPLTKSKKPEAAMRNESPASVAKTPIEPAEVVKINRNPSAIPLMKIDTISSGSAHSNTVSPVDRKQVVKPHDGVYTPPKGETFTPTKKYSKSPPSGHKRVGSSPVIPGSSLLSSIKMESPIYIEKSTKQSTRSKNQTQLDSINHMLAQSSLSPVHQSTLNSIRGLLDFDSPVGPARTLNRTPKTTSNLNEMPSWSMDSPMKPSNKRSLDSNGDLTMSSGKKPRNAALISSILNSTTSTTDSDESLATFLEETVKDDEPSPCHRSTTSNENQFSMETDVNQILGGSIGQLRNHESPTSSVYVTPHVQNKTQRGYPPIDPLKKPSFRTRVIQQFGQYGWRAVAPKLNDRDGSYKYTHDKLQNQYHFTREQLVSYAQVHDIFTNRSFMDPNMVYESLRDGNRKILKSVKPRPSTDWSI